ncbi:Ig-like domain-containing protein [Nocardioides jishulii]|uniref:Signal peptidase I n=1 Tax=Nocardioides jishulii TaxID=2575440 RepID=A0A4V5TR52_9ACTN|nr:Ig-like domain-containing protein [Nocardioides jishulii]QCX28494.1 signal peptidase I [Nocardioides jishulii]TKI64613.1 signal peptidase I [Nocardioides jishulii]
MTPPSCHLHPWVALVAAALVTLVAVDDGPVPSGATFTSNSRAAGQVTAAADWTAPTVAVVSPGSSVKDVTTIAVEASDAESGIGSVTLEQLAPGTDVWVTVCTDTTAPYSCAWDTRPLADGSYALRARATDRTGLQATSAEVRTTVANRLVVTLDSPGDEVRGTVALTTAVHNPGTLTHTVRLEYAAEGASTWRAICSGLRSPYACAWNTTTVASGDYELRAVVLDSQGRAVATSTLVEVTVDNVAPTVTMVDPGSPLSGTRTFAATASDAHSGLELVVLQYAATGTSVWRDLCTLTQEPWSCRVATSTLPDGSYSLRAVATDAAGNSTTSAPVTQRLVDNTVSSISVDGPDLMTGTVQVTAAASSTADVAQVRFQYAVDGSSTWTDLCTDTAAPWSCAWDTTTVPNGTYSLRAVMVDGLGRSLTSAAAPGHRVDNTPLRGLDVQTANGGTSAGRTDNGDTMTFTYSGAVNPGSLLAGWDGTARNVSVRLRDGAVLKLGKTDDTIDVLTTNGAAVHLGSVNLKGDYIRKNRTATYASTMTARTTTLADGTQQTTVTLKLGSVYWLHLTYPRTVRSSSTMAWSPSALATDTLGRACSTALVHESGAADREF